MGVQNSYTMEVSMGGSKIGTRCGTHFSSQDYEQIGKVFCETLLDFSDQDPIKVAYLINILIAFPVFFANHCSFIIKNLCFIKFTKVHMETIKKYILLPYFILHKLQLNLNML